MMDVKSLGPGSAASWSGMYNGVCNIGRHREENNIARTKRWYRATAKNDDQEKETAIANHISKIHRATHCTNTKNRRKQTEYEIAQTSRQATQ